MPTVASTHQEHRRDHERLAAHPIPVVAEQRGADRAGGEADKEGREGEEGAREWIGLWKEFLRKHGRRGDPVEEEVVPLDGRTNRGHGDCPDHHPALVERFHRRSTLHCSSRGEHL